MGKILDSFNTTDGEMGKVCTGANGSPQNLSKYFIKSSVCKVNAESALKDMKITPLETKYQINWQLFLKENIQNACLK